MAASTTTAIMIASDVTAATLQAAVGAPVALLGLLGMIGVLFLAALGTWAIMRFAWVPYRLHVDASSINEGIVVVSLQAALGGAASAVLSQGQSTASAAANVAQRLRDNLFFILGLLVLTAIALVFWFAHPQILGLWLELRQCGTRAIIDRLAFPVLNLARLLYAIVIPVVDAFAEMFWFFTLGWARLLFACTDLRTLGDLARDLAGGVGGMLTAVASWLVNGLFTGGRIAWLGPVAELQLGFNATRPVLDCFCGALAPVWDWLLGMLEAPSIPVAADCAINVPARFFQLVLGIISTLELPSTNNITVELQCTLTSTGDVVEDVVQVTIQFIYDLFALIDSLASASTDVRAAANGYRAARWGVAVRKRAASAVSTVNLTIARPLRFLGALWHASAIGANKPVEPVTDAAGEPLYHAAFGSGLGGGGFPQSWWIFHLPTNVSGAITLFLGIDALLAVSGTPWSHIFTEPVAALWGVGNITLMVVSHPLEAFANSSGIRYFQFGLPGDRLRIAADALAQLTVAIDRSFPCSFSSAFQAIASIPDGVLEFFFALVYAVIFPPWLPGEPTPAPLPSPTIFDFAPAYYDWQGSRLRRSLALLHTNEQCVAFMLGCNTTAPNNPNASFSNCTEQPVACLGRSLSHLVEETVNQTLNLLLYVPALVQFSPPRHTFVDLKWERLRDAWYDLIACLGALVDLLDFEGDMCLTNAPGAGRPEPNPNGTVTMEPAIDVVVNVARSAYTCDTDGLAYYLDGQPTQPSTPLVTSYRGRGVVLRATNLSSGVVYDSQLHCLTNASLGCNITSSLQAQQIGDVAQGGNVTFRLRSRLYAGIMNVTYNAASKTFTTTASNLVSQGFNVSNGTYTISNCTDSGSRTWPRPDGMACLNGHWIYVEPYDSTRSLERIGSIKNGPAGPLVPCDMNENTLSPVVASIIVSGVTPYRVYEYDPELGTLVSRPVVVQISSNPLVEVQLNYSDVPGLKGPVNAACLWNQLVGLNTDQSIAYRNASRILPVYYTSVVTGKKVHVACDVMLPPTYECVPAPVLLPGGAPAYTPTLNITSPNRLYVDFGNVTALNKYVPCDMRSIIPTPQCTELRYSVSYSNSATPDVVSIVVEDAQVRISYNDSTPQIMTCGGTFVSAAELAASTAVPPVSISTAPLSMQQLWQLATQDVEREAARRQVDTSGLVASAAALEWLARAAPTAIYSSANSNTLARLFSLASVNLSLPVFRKQIFICYVSDAVREAGDFVVAFIWEWVRTIRTILTLPADPSTPFDLPTFEIARDHLRASLCDAVTAGAYILPQTFSCAGMQTDAGCGTGNECVAHFLCDVIDVPILLVDIPIDVLRTIRAVLQTNTSSLDIFAGTSCSPSNPAGCFVAFLVYVVKKVLFTVTLVFRGGAAVLDCVLCAILPGPCGPIIYTFVAALADLVDGLGALFLTSVLNFIVGIVECIIYFFSGQFGKLINAFINEVLGAIGGFFSGLGSLILQFLLQLPVIGDIIRFIVGIIRDACGVLQDVIDLFGGGNIGCGSISVKRAGQDTGGWLSDSIWSNVTSVWAAGQPAEFSCGARMAVLNATDLGNLTVDEQREALFCLLASVWVGPLAPAEVTAVADQAFAPECDLLMPALYRGTDAWPNLTDAIKARALPCLEQRWRADRIRLQPSGRGSWVPHDLFYTDSGAWIRLVDDMRVAYDAYAQYAADRAATTSMVMSAAYAADWASRGYDTSHLEALHVLNDTAAAATALASDNSTLGLGLIDYAARLAATAATVRRKRSVMTAPLDSVSTFLLGDRTYSADRLAGIAAHLWQPVIGGSTSAPNNQSLWSFVWEHTAQAAETAGNAAGLSVPLVPETMWAMAAANDTRLLQQTMHGMTLVWTRDVPAMVVALSKPAQVETLKRVLSGSLNVPLRLLQASLALVRYGADWAMGSMAATADWYRDAAVRDAWLAAHPETGLPLAANVSLDPGNPDTGAPGAFATAALKWFPQSWPLAHMGRFFASEAMISASTSMISVMGAGPSRSYSLARFRRMLGQGFAAAATAQYVKQVRGDYGVSNTTGLECLTNYTSLCQECQWADWLVFHLVHSFNFMAGAYGGTSRYCSNHPENSFLCDNSTLGRVAYSRAQYEAFNAYTFDDNACAELGDSANNSVRWPWQDRSNWGLFGDPTPNKLRFDDVADTATTSWDIWLGEFNNAVDAFNWSTLDDFQTNSSAAAVASVNAASRGAGPRFWAQVHAPPTAPGAGRSLTALLVDEAVAVGKDVLPRLGLKPRAATQQERAAAVARAAVAQQTRTDAAAFTPPPLASNASSGAAALWWFEFAWWRVRACSYDTELDGSTKRFSIGEVVLMALAVALGVGILLGIIFPGQFLLLFAGIGAAFGMLLLFGGLVVAYDWSYGCLPALPISLADDVLYFLSHTLAPKCPVEGGLVNEADYDNCNCYACENWQNGRWTLPSCTLSRNAGGRFGFEDISYHLAFILHELWPALLQTLKDTSYTSQIPIVGPIVTSDAFQARLSAFDAFNATGVTAVTFSQMHQCNGWLLPTNLIIAAFLLTLIIIALPLLVRALGLMLGLLYTALLGMLVVMQTIGLIGVYAAQPPREEMSDAYSRPRRASTAGTITTTAMPITSIAAPVTTVRDDRVVELDNGPWI